MLEFSRSDAKQAIFSQALCLRKQNVPYGTYLCSGHKDLDAAIVADVRGRVQQLLDVVGHAAQLEIGGHHVFAAVESRRKRQQ